MRNLATVTALACAVAASIVALPGCVSLKRSPEARYFVLRSAVEPASVVEPGSQPDVEPGRGADAGLEPLVGFLPVRIPDALARPQLVTFVTPGELRLDPLRRWAEPLDEGVARTVADDLSALLPRWRVVRAPWPATTPLRARLLVELRDFAPRADGSVRLDGTFALLDPRDERSLDRRPFSLERKAAAGDDAAAVQAMSEILAELARRIAPALEALPATPSGGR